MISFKKLFIILLFLTYVAFIFIKFNFGQATPDEIFYTADKSTLLSLGYDFSQMSIKFRITYLLIRNVFLLNPFLFQIINVLLTLIVFNVFYTTQKQKGFVISKDWILILFLLPTVLFFMSAYLRDIYIFLLGVLILNNLQENNGVLNRGLIFYLVLVFLLRPEAAGLFVVAFLINKFILSKRNARTKISKTILVYFLILFCFFSIVLFFDSIWMELTSLLERYEKSTEGFTIWQQKITKLNFVPLSFLNWIAYYSPVIFKFKPSLYGLITFIDSLILLYLFFKLILFRVTKSSFYTDKVFSICVTLFLLTLLISIPETLPETIYRHHLFYIPFLFYAAVRKASSI